MENKDSEAAMLLTRKEKEADEARRILIDELNRTFVTPFDREDIFALSRAIDDVLDYAYSTVDEMEILNVEPTAYMQRIGVAGDHAQRSKALENRVESVYREALADLFSEVTGKDNDAIVKILKQREVYRHLSNAADRGDEAANVIADIVVKAA